MTEAEWNACTDPQPMLEFLRGKVSDRKVWLVGCGNCRRIWHLMSDLRSRHAIEVAERFADGHASKAELQKASEEARRAWKETYDLGTAAASQASWITQSTDRSWLEWIALNNSQLVASAFTGHGEPPPARVLRCIFGPLPFRPIALDPSWLTSTVTSLATAIYQERAFDRLPIWLMHWRTAGAAARRC
jgi:hypothetical protein